MARTTRLHTIPSLCYPLLWIGCVISSFNMGGDQAIVVYTPSTTYYGTIVRNAEQHRLTVVGMSDENCVVWHQRLELPSRDCASP